MLELCCCLCASLGAALLSPAAVLAQEKEVPPLRVSGVAPAGVRSSATESWGTYDVKVTNFTDVDRLARVVLFFPNQPTDGNRPRNRVQYGRDVWVPPHSTLSTWMLVGPAIRPEPAALCEIEFLLYDRTDGKDRLILPRTEERTRSRAILHRRREPYTSIMLDEEPAEGSNFGKLPQPDSKNEEAVRLARAFRLTQKLSEFVHTIYPGPLPPSTEGFDGIDHFILGSGRIARDPGGMQALRHWLERGGKMWVMLDLIDSDVLPDVLAPLLGDALDFQVVDRVGLTSFRIQVNPVAEGMPEPPLQEHERPVPFVRVLLPPQERVKYTVNGWPVWFTRPVGRGEVVFSTLGPRAWYRPREAKEPPAPFLNLPYFPVPLSHLEDLAWRLRAPSEAERLPVESFEPMLTGEIGYSVVHRGTVVLVFAGFLLAALALGVVLRKSPRPELLGWLGPVAALGATGAFLLVGSTSRNAVPPTVAVARIVDAVSGKDEVAVHGLLAVYHPDSGPVRAGTDRGGFFELNTAGLEDQSRRFVLTDMDSWHWEDLALPAGVRLAPFHYTLPTREPIAAIAHFGPEGIEGRLAAGPFQDLADVLLSTPSGRNFAIQLKPDGTFRAGSSDILPRGQFLASAVLNDRQQRRQAVYRQFVKPTAPGKPEGHPTLLAWSDSAERHFLVGPPEPETRTVGNSLLVLPLRLERSAPGVRITIPGPFLRYERILPNGSLTHATLESNIAVDQHLRFQLPPEVLPFQIERARLFAKIDAPTRRFTISGQADGKPVEIHSAENPFEPINIEIAQKELLHPDERGGLHLNVSISDPLKGNQPGAHGSSLDEKWKIDYLELEVTGQPMADSR